MKKTFIAAVAAVSLTGMAAAFAAPQALDEATKAGTVQISKASTHYRLGAGEFKDYAATYKLDNGSAVQFSQNGNRYYVQMKGEQRAELYPTAAGRFLTARGVDIAFYDEGETVSINNIHRLPNSVAMAAVEGAVIARR